MANKWLVALKTKNTPHNTPTTLREADNGDTPAGGEIGQTPEKPLAKTAKIPERPKKRTPRKKKLTPEEEEKHRSH